MFSTVGSIELGVQLYLDVPWKSIRGNFRFLQQIQEAKQ